MQLLQDAGFPAHVVGFWGNGPKGRAPQHALPLPDLQQVSEVRGAGGELPDLQFALGYALHALSKTPLDGGDIEPLPLTHAYGLRHRASLVGWVSGFGSCLSLRPDPPPPRGSP